MLGRVQKMPRSGPTDVQMIASAKQMGANRKAEDIARKIYAWKANCDGMDVSEVQEAELLPDENAWLRE
jgi:hypothetical protein